MRLASIVSAAALLVATVAYAADTPHTVAILRQRVETADYRATGRLVTVDASGKRSTSAITIETHWFPGVLRTLVEIVPPPGAKASQYPRMAILLETRPNGENTIRIFHPHQPGASLPFAEWSKGVAGSDFSYEDLLEPEYFWPDQTITESVKFAGHDCDVLKSTPGASDRTHYAEVQTWLDHTILYPIHTEKTLKSGDTVKEFTSLGLTHSGGVWAARQIELKVRGHNGSSLMIFDRGSTKANLGVKDFSAERISQFEDHP